MAVSSTLVLLALLMAFTALGVYGFIHFARKVALLDVPNARSSHQLPVPRGGGVVFAVTTIGAWAWLAFRGNLSPEQATALVLPASIIVVLGFLDDRFNLPRIFRFTVQLGVAALAVWLATGDKWPLLAAVAATVAIAWMINLFNFMDGIDGMAALYSITLGLALSATLLLRGHPDATLIVLPLCAALGGFLIFNWPPARLFMGDAGSTFLGLSFSIMALLSHGYIDVVVFATLPACFLTDTGWTLATRAITGQRWARAHRLHAYQKWAAKLRSHAVVTMVYSAYTALWLFPLVCLDHFFDFNPLVTLSLAYGPALLTCYMLRAGRPENSSQRSTNNQQ